MNYRKLKIGDCLLYSGNSPLSWLIKIKTWNKITHCEMYFVNGTSTASRDGIGTGVYPFRDKGLIKVLRPIIPFDSIKLVEFINNTDNQPYDWFGLLRFVWIGKVPFGNNKKMFCSEYMVRAYRAAGLEMFNKVDADTIAPWMFELLPNFEDITHLVK